MTRMEPVYACNHCHYRGPAAADGSDVALACPRCKTSCGTNT